MPPSSGLSPPMKACFNPRTRVGTKSGRKFVLTAHPTGLIITQSINESCYHHWKIILVAFASFRRPQ